MPYFYNPYLVAAAATIGGMLFGFDISSVSAFVSDDDYLAFFNSPDSVRQGGITASMAGGSFLGSLASGPFSDVVGRKYAIQVGAVIWIIGSAVQCSVQNTAQLICGRVISGVAIGICSAQVPVYISELSPKRIRGRLVGLFQWAVTWGIMIMFYISYGCSFIDGPASFRTAWGIQMVPGALLLSALFFFPESPRWLASHDRWEESIDIIRHVQGIEGDQDSDELRIELQELKEAVRIDQLSKELGYRDLFRKGSRLRTFVGVTAQIWQQLTGMNVMMYYVVYTFDMAGYTGNTGLVSSSIQYVINMVMTVPALLFIDKWGRRPLLIYGAIAQCIWLFAVSGLMAQYGHYVDALEGNANIRWTVPDKTAAKAIIACNYLFVASFAMTWGPGIWLYVSEIFPMRQRASGNGFCAAWNWIFNFALAFFVPPAFRNIQWKTYLIFAVFCIAMSFHVFFLFPETKGKTLEEVDIIWEEHIAPWKSAKVDVSELATNRDLLSKHEKQYAIDHDEHLSTAGTVTAPGVNESVPAQGEYESKATA
ncbi:general substrate transporter [Kockiozyma suomiensis]|uniref:general substrate transporter n=1 Tax=Kockiozyma suomiensis TaxID=1337062 RepID=UPI0033443601